MTASLILTGDVNLLNVTDPAVPFTRVRAAFSAASLVFGNLECCLHAPAGGHSFHNEGFYAAPGPGGEALRAAGFAAVSIANNVNYGEAAILDSVARLDALGIAHTGAGRNAAAAGAPAIVTRDGVRFGFLQRSAVYWPTNHEAGPETTGIAVLRAHTAWQVPMHKTRPEIPPLNRPGLPPIVRTWADRDSLRAFTDDIARLRGQTDMVVASCHWGLGKDVLEYMTETAHAAIDAGAEVVIGHGPHVALPVAFHRGKPIFYGLGSFSFHTGHGGRAHGDWVGMMARVVLEAGRVAGAAFRFVRHNAANETVPCRPADEAEALDALAAASAGLGAVLRPGEEWVAVEPAG